MNALTFDKIAVIITDPKKKIVWVNKTFTSMTGYEPTEVIGKSPAILQGKETLESSIHELNQKIEEHKPFLFNIKNHKKTGEEYICSLSIYPVFNRKNKISNFIAFEFDKTQYPDGVLPHQFSDKYVSSSLRIMQSYLIFDKIKTHIQKYKGYLSPNFKLENVAKALSTNSKYLSQAINQNTGYNFLKLINKYRIEEAKNQLLSKENENLTLFGVALKCGFKNKSTFYKVFKEIEGRTPKEFKEHIRVS